MFSMCSELTPRARIPDTRIPQQMQTCSKAQQKFSFMTKPQLPNLQQTVANTILIININNSNNCGDA